MERVDPHKLKNTHEKWKKRRSIDGISSFNSQIITNYITDMELGHNARRPGSKSYAQLNNLRHRMKLIATKIEEVYSNRRLIDITEPEILLFFTGMRTGEIETATGLKYPFLKRDGTQYVSVDDYIKVFCAFWHWYMRSEAAKGNTVPEITSNIDKSPVNKESTFVYFDEVEVYRLIENAKFDYRVLIKFLFDSGIRAPTELMNIRVSDLHPIPGSDNFHLKIRDEISKTFGRMIKLLLCSKDLKHYIAEKRLAPHDFLFTRHPTIVNQYLRRLSVRVFGNRQTLGGEYTGKITMYDMRHCAACYWAPKYKDPKAYIYRFGWTSLNMYYYYTKLIGMGDNIMEEDLIGDDAKTQIEKQLEQERCDKQILLDRLEAQTREMDAFRSEFAASKSMQQNFVKFVHVLLKNGPTQHVVRAIEEGGLTDMFMDDPSGMQAPPDCVPDPSPNFIGEDDPGTVRQRV